MPPADGGFKSPPQRANVYSRLFGGPSLVAEHGVSDATLAQAYAPRVCQETKRLCVSCGPVLTTPEKGLGLLCVIPGNDLRKRKLSRRWSEVVMESQVTRWNGRHLLHHESCR